METYLRFETTCRCSHSRRPLGVFRTAGRLKHRDDLPDMTSRRLTEALDWFNDNLTVPERRLIQRRGVFWFRSSAHDVIDRIWDLIAVLDEQGVFVEFHKTSRPGAIIYQDKQQIAAIPNRR